MKRSTLTLAVAAAALCLSMSAARAESTNSSTPHDEKSWHEQHMQRMERMCQSPSAHHEKALEESEAKLTLTPAQKPAWDKFAETVKAAHQGMIAQMCAKAKEKAEATTLPERLAQAEQKTQARLTSLQAQRAALEDLYKTLSPEQQKVANALPLFAPHDRHGHEGHEGHHTGHGE